MNLKKTAGINIVSKYESDLTFPPIAWGDVAHQCRNFSTVGQKTIVIAHNIHTVRAQLNSKGFGVTIKATAIPYHFEVEIKEKNRYIKDGQHSKTAKA